MKIVISSIVWQINGRSTDMMKGACYLHRKNGNRVKGRSLGTHRQNLKELEISVLAAKCPIFTDNRNPWGSLIGRA